MIGSHIGENRDVLRAAKVKICFSIIVRGIYESH